MGNNGRNLTVNSQTTPLVVPGRRQCSKSSRQLGCQGLRMGVIIVATRLTILGAVRKLILCLDTKRLETDMQQLVRRIVVTVRHQSPI